MLKFIQTIFYTTAVLLMAGLINVHSGDQLISASSLQAAAIYKWVDANGVLHYSDKPNKKSQKLVINVPSNKVEEDPQEKNLKESEALFDAQDKQRIAQECQKAKQNIAVLNSGNRVTQKNSEGEDIDMTAAEKAEQLQRNQTYVDTYCQGASTATDGTEEEV